MDAEQAPTPEMNELFRIAGIPHHLRDDLRNVRILLQYLMLDLEATRRENDLLRKIVYGLDPDA